MKFARNLFTVLFVCFAYLATNNAFAQNTSESKENDPADAIIGLWAPSNGKARIQIYERGDKYYGRIVWLKEPNDPNTGKPKVDKNNSIESMRTAPLLGYSLLRELAYVGDNKWENGTIYDPENGSTYNCKMELTDSNTLDVRGFIGVAVFGRTDTWKRLQQPKK